MASSSSTPTLADAGRQMMRLGRLIRAYWGPLSKGMLLGPVVALFGIIPPYLTKLLIDEVYPSQDVNLLNVILLGLVGAYIGTAFVSFLQRLHTLHYEVRVRNELRLLFFNHLQHLPLDFFTKHRVGELTSRFRDSNSALVSLTSMVRTAFTKGLYLILVPPVLFYLNWTLALVAVIAIPLTIAVVTLAGRQWREAWKKASEAYSDLYAHNVEALSQIRMVKAMALEHEMYDKAAEQMGRATKTHRRSGRINIGVNSINEALRMGNMALFTWLGWTFILNGSMTLGSFVAFTTYVTFLYDPLKQLVDQYGKFQQSSVNLWRMFEYLDEEPEQNPENAMTRHAPIRHRLSGEMKLEDVTFAYDEDPVLDGLSMHVHSQETIAVVGPSGTGKTTLLRLLTALEPPSSGRILMDGRNVQGLPLTDVRRQVVAVWQELTMFEGTIRTNLALGLDDVEDEELDRITKLCQIHDLILDSEDGYDTKVSEWGSSLSGGQRQRLVLARALMRNAPIYLLDEITSNLDAETEAQLLPALFQELQDRTVLFVTHRVDSARYADRICVLQDGKVAGIGTHTELQATCDAYVRLCEAGASV